ncbi:MAG: peptidoglycan-binding protein [Proteobacteria bacterium]|nr:peptidoglycan-binding protein [Pseudomonadota bacterium]
MHPDPFGDRPGFRYIPDPLGRLNQGHFVRERDLPDPFGRLMAKPEPEPEISNFRNPLRIRDSVGIEGRNNRRDVAKVESLFGRLGELNLDETNGVTGFAGARLDEAIRRFQKRNQLKVDGQVTPGGETITTTGAVLAASEKKPDSENDKGDKPDEHLIPERPGDTRDPMETNPSVPRTRDKGEFDIEWWNFDPPIGKRT